MKKMQFPLFMALIFSAVLTQSSNAQLVQASAKSTTESTTFTAEGNASGFKSAEKFNKAGLRAMRSFTESNAGIANAKWHVDENIIYASANNDGKQTTAVYDKRGRWLHTVCNYKESLMPKEVRSMVKRSIYYDDTINGVQEITTELGTFYIVHLENPTEYRQVVVAEGEINLFKQFKKS